MDPDSYTPGLVNIIVIQFYTTYIKDTCIDINSSKYHKIVKIHQSLGFFASTYLFSGTTSPVLVFLIASAETEICG